MGPSRASYWEPFGPQYASKTASRAPKTRPTAPKRPPRPLQERPRGLPGRPKRPPRPLQEALRMPRSSGTPLGSYLGPMLPPCWSPFARKYHPPHKPVGNCSRGIYKTPSNTGTWRRTGQKQSPTPLNDDSSGQQNRRATPQNKGAAVDRHMASYKK